MVEQDRPPDRNPPGENAIEGIVTDFDGVPLAGVLVEAVRTGGGPAHDGEETGADGRFRIEGLGPGRYDLRFELDRVTARATAVPAGTDQVRIRLTRPQGILLVVKVPPGAEEPAVYRYVVEREAPTGPVREQAGRTVRARVLLWGLHPGRYAVVVGGGTWAPVRVEGIQVEERGTAPQVEALLSTPGGTIEGRVVRGSAGVEAMVAWRRLGEREPWPRTETSAASGPDGRFTVRGLASGRYLVSAALPRGPIVDAEVVVTAGDTAPVEMRLG